MASFDDLRTRLLSAAALIAIGLTGIWIGGDVFALLVIAVAGVMGWELSRMFCHNPMVPLIFGILTSAIVLCTLFQPLPVAAVIAAIALGAIWLGHRRGQGWMSLQAAVLLGGAISLVVLRDGAPVGRIFCLIGIVIASDVGGYFGGRLLGGPKLWPAVSPKKTWSGTLTGWALAVGVGLLCAGFDGTSLTTAALVALALCIAAQAGDLLESHVKRQAGVKDSSALIPGHGGVLDRFDALLGAACLYGFLVLIGG